MSRILSADERLAIEAEIPRLRRFARCLVRDVDRADDLVQECLVRAIAKMHTWQPGTNLRAWLFTILKNCHINEVRRARTTVPLEPDTTNSVALTAQSNQDARVAVREVQEAFSALSGDHREILLLVAIEGMSYEAAAHILGTAVGTVRSRLSRARHALRVAVDQRQVPNADNRWSESAVDERARLRSAQRRTRLERV